eukprot:CAMPEP_0185166706 /NCGR_PEP_ID=MMETSP1139-20130426/13074_1 /TAXON_ID=298111 /ORGANISM="Pavlova sp., Strain CCMP459" /LENGTH=130 /DNA_ID=CAMNT_0027732165 /DNA_START=491 /DNA_END=879 /DNA_ORIENTATION=-
MAAARLPLSAVPGASRLSLCTSTCAQRPTQPACCSLQPTALSLNSITGPLRLPLGYPSMDTRNRSSTTGCGSDYSLHAMMMFGLPADTTLLDLLLILLTPQSSSAVSRVLSTSRVLLLRIPTSIKSSVKT